MDFIPKFALNFSLTHWCICIRRIAKVWLYSWMDGYDEAVSEWCL